MHQNDLKELDYSSSFLILWCLVNITKAFMVILVYFLTFSLRWKIWIHKIFYHHYQNPKIYSLFLLFNRWWVWYLTYLFIVFYLSINNLSFSSILDFILPSFLGVEIFLLHNIGKCIAKNSSCSKRLEVLGILIILSCLSSSHILKL